MSCGGRGEAGWIGVPPFALAPLSGRNAMIYQHWIGTLTLDPAAQEAAPRPVDLWLPTPAPVRATRFEYEPWPALALDPLAPPGSRFAGTVEYWYGDDEDDEDL